MSSISMGASKQVVRPPQRGIFPLDHMSECRDPMELYLQCLRDNEDRHHMCRDYSKRYLQCRMDRGLMSKENLDDMGFSGDAAIRGTPKEYDRAKELGGYVAGKHIKPKEELLRQRQQQQLREQRETPPSPPSSPSSVPSTDPSSSSSSSSWWASWWRQPKR